MATSLSQTQIYLSKRLRLVMHEGSGGSSPSLIATASKNLQSLGFGIKQSILDRLSSYSESELIDWYETIVPVLKEMVGADCEFNPMYPNFPRQVMEASEAELYFNAITHYFGFALSDALGDPSLVVLPQYRKAVRPELDELHELRWIELGSEVDFDNIFTKLVAANGSLSESDKDILLWFIDNRDVKTLLPAEIPQKETLAILVSTMDDKEFLKGHIKTATDILRIAVAMSNGDVSLAESTKFRNFSKRGRRFLLECLERAGNSRTEDMLRWKDRWVRLGERLHPGDFKNRFPLALAAFDTLRNGLPFESFNSKIESQIHDGDIRACAKSLSKRPGDFARRLDHLLRIAEVPSEVLESFFETASQVSTPVLLQAWAHFQHRDGCSSRAFFPKGNAAKVQLSETPLPSLSSDLVKMTANRLRRVLIERFANLNPLGKCFLDERLKHQLVPFSQRSASRTLRTVARGSSFDLPKGDTIRLFCWWKNLVADEESERVDIDLSATLFGEDWQYLEDIAYYNLRSGECFHSGDITSAPDGACEFIDINLPSIVNRKARYVVMSVLCYTRQAFTSMPECFGGWMMRQNPNSGEIFEPKTVVDKVDLTAPSRSCVPVIVDAHDRRVYWTDIALKSRSQINNAARNSVGFSQIGKAILSLKKATLHDLFAMHIEGRGTLVSNRRDADTIFDLHDGTVTAFDSHQIMSSFMS